MKSEKAFTILEVVIAIGIFAIVAVPIVSMFLDGIKITSKSENTSEAYAYAQQYVEKLKGGEIEVANAENVEIIDTDYTYSINVKSLKTQEELNEQKKNDGEDFYQYMNDEKSTRFEIGNRYLCTYIYGNIDFVYEIALSENIRVDEDCAWELDTAGVTHYIDNYAISATASNIWIDFSYLTEPTELKINNESGKILNIYLQSTEDNKKNLKIKNLGGTTKVYGPVTENVESSEERGRKHIAEVTVTVENTRTKEQAELTANVTYFE